VVAGASAQDVPGTPLGAPQAGDLEILAGEQQTDGPLRMARGNVELRMNGMILNADEIDYNEQTADIEARGNVRYRNSESDEDLYAAKVAYNTRTETGTFYDTRGTVASASQGGMRILTTDNPFYIEGKVVNKARGHYIVHDGFVTNCDITRPWWTTFIGSV
jgi:lipopolysaccharide assembly outer membrane protein LptD (OstA)